jgi:hypothetical protein
MTSGVLLMCASTRIVWDLAAHVVAGYLHFEESPISTHAELVAQPVTTTQLVSTGGTG